MVRDGVVIYSVQVRPYRLPLRAAVRTAHGVLTAREGALVRLEDPATGRAGLGEASPLPGFGTETADGVESALRTMDEKATAEQLADLIARAGCAGFAVESALKEIRRAGEKIPALTGGGTAETLPVAALLPAGRAALGKIAALGEAGFRTFKWKVGVAPAGEELPLLDDVCAALPPGARLRLDANGAWDRRAAERWLERCAERPVELVEQPCLAGPGAGAADLARTEDLLRGLAADFPVRIALDESLAGPGDVDRWLAADWRGVWVIKLGLLGGAALEKLSRARADLVFSSALETAVGARAALRAAFAWNAARTQRAGSKASGGSPTPPRALGFGVWPLFADARFDGPHLAPFLRARDVDTINVEAAWSALS